MQDQNWENSVSQIHHLI